MYVSIWVPIGIGIVVLIGVIGLVIWFAVQQKQHPSTSSASTHGSLQQMRTILQQLYPKAQSRAAAAATTKVPVGKPTLNFNTDISNEWKSAVDRLPRDQKAALEACQTGLSNEDKFRIVERLARLSSFDASLNWETVKPYVENTDVSDFEQKDDLLAFYLILMSMEAKAESKQPTDLIVYDKAADTVLVKGRLREGFESEQKNVREHFNAVTNEDFEKPISTAVFAKWVTLIRSTYIFNSEQIPVPFSQCGICELDCANDLIPNPRLKRRS